MQLPVGFGLKIYNPFLTTYSPFSGEAHFLLLTSLPPRVERFAAQQGWEKQVGLGVGILQKKELG